MREYFGKIVRMVTADNASRHALRRMSLFAALILVLAVLLHIWISAGLRRITTSNFGVWNQIVSGSVNADVVISGSSRAMSHYDPAIISNALGLNVYNIGLNGAQTDMQLARLKVYLEHNKQPALIIHNLDIFSLQLSHGDVYDLAQYVPYLHERALYQPLSRAYPPIWKSTYIPLYGYTVEDLRFTWVIGLRALMGWNPLEDHVLGFRPRDISWTEDFEKLRANKPQGVSFAIEPGGVQEIENVLRLCKERGIKVIMVYSPEYEEVQRLTQNRSDAFRTFAELASKFDAQLWDYSSSDISADRRNFYNSQHLNSKGAEKFSQQLASRLAADAEVRTLASGSRPTEKAAQP